MSVELDMVADPKARIRELEECIRDLEAERDERKKQAEYWEARATTTEEKVKDWSVRVVEQDIRIRSLEADARQRDLLEERIAKAREILANTIGVLLKPPQRGLVIPDDVIRKTLDALEGK